MKIKDLIFHLPRELIPQQFRKANPKLLVVNEGRVFHKNLCDLPEFISKGDVLVFNDTKVIPTRLWARRSAGGEVEVDLITKIKRRLWIAMLRPDYKFKVDDLIYFSRDFKAKLLSRDRSGRWLIRFSHKGSFLNLLKHYGSINQPFYLSREIKLNAYQTAYARREGSAQPPTAGFYFSKSFLDRLKNKGIGIDFVTLHIGGSILSFDIEDSGKLKIEKEWCSVSGSTASMINMARSQGGRIIAVGTSVARALESARDKAGFVRAYQGFTDLTIKPGYRFRAIDGFLTNFHQPASSHLLLTSSFLGRRHDILSIYKEALKRKFKFLDFGDKMLILRSRADKSGL